MSFLILIRVYFITISFQLQTPQSGLKDQISEKIWNKLSEGQQQLLLESEEKNKPSIVDDNQALPIVKEITKMQLPQTDSAGN